MQTFLFYKVQIHFLFFQSSANNFMNYICLIALIMSAGDGKSWPAAKGRYKYSNMKTKNPTTLPCVHRVETFNTPQRWLVTQFSAFQTLSESCLWVRRGAVLQWGASGGPVDSLGGGLFGIFGKGGGGHVTRCLWPLQKDVLLISPFQN